MDDKSILFFSITMILVFGYRIILSILLLTKKKYLIDEKYYIAVFYTSLVGCLVLFTNWLVAGIVLFLLLPIILTLYVSFAPTRKYWIINDYKISESTFINKIAEYDERYLDPAFRIDRIRFSRKASECKTRLDFLNLKYEEKEKLLKIVKDICKEHTTNSNKHEIYSILINGFFILVMVFFIIFVLFT